MGARVPLKTRQARIYRRLKKMQYELAQNVIEPTYKRQQLFYRANNGDGFVVEYHWIYASNGESAAARVINIYLGETITQYGSWKSTAKTFEIGLSEAVRIFAPREVTQ